MVAAEVDAWADADGTHGRLERARVLLRLRMRDAVALQVAPGTRDITEPVLHLRDDEAAELGFGEFLHAENGDGDEVLGDGRVRRSHFAHDSAVVDGAGAVAIEDQHGPGDGRFFGGVVETGDAAGGGLGFADKMGGGRTVGGDDDGAGAKRFAAGESYFVFVERFDTRVEADRIRGELGSDLRGDRTHTARGNAGISFREHFEDEFKHAAGGFQLA